MDQISMSRPETAAGASTYRVGQDPHGHWVVLEDHGRGGGLFVSRAAAMTFVRLEAGHSPLACRLVADPIGLPFSGTSSDDA